MTLEGFISEPEKRASLLELLHLAQTEVRTIKFIVLKVSTRFIISQTPLSNTKLFLF